MPATIIDIYIRSFFRFLFVIFAIKVIIGHTRKSA